MPHVGRSICINFPEICCLRIAFQMSFYRENFTEEGLFQNTISKEDGFLSINDKGSLSSKTTHTPRMTLQSFLALDAFCPMISQTQDCLNHYDAQLNTVY